MAFASSRTWSLDCLGLGVLLLWLWVGERMVGTERGAGQSLRVRRPAQDALRSRSSSPFKWVFLQRGV